MYSPKIDENLIPVRYRKAKDRGMAMTKLVNGLLRNALAQESLCEVVGNSSESSAFSRKTLRHHLSVLSQEAAVSPVIRES